MSQGDDTTSYNTYSVDDETQLQPEDTLVDRGVDDVLDEGYTAPDNWSPAETYGNTALEEVLGEPLDMRLAEEEPDTAAEELKRAGEDEDTTNPAGVEINADLEGEGALVDDLSGELVDDEVGDLRAGRLVAPDEGIRPDTESSMVADDEGFSGGAASAEEAAVHIIPDDDDL